MQNWVNVGGSDQYRWRLFMSADQLLLHVSQDKEWVVVGDCHQRRVDDKEVYLIDGSLSDTIKEAFRHAKLSPDQEGIEQACVVAIGNRDQDQQGGCEVAHVQLHIPTKIFNELTVLANDFLSKRAAMRAAKEVEYHEETKRRSDHRSEKVGRS